MDNKGTWSVWKMPYSKRYYITHPWKWFKDAAGNIRDAYRRARYGWTYVDCWNWNTWFLQVTPPMLRHMADFGSAYPGVPPFDGEHGSDRWHEWLHEVADLLETGREEWQEEHNEYYEEYMEHLMDNWEKPTKDEKGFYHHKAPEFTDIDKKYFARAKELMDEGEKNVARALGMIGEHFPAIWD